MELSSHTALFFAFCILLFATHTEANRAGVPRLKFCDYIMQIGGQNPHCPPQGMGRSVKLRDQEADTEPKEATDTMTTDDTTPSSASTPAGYKSCFLKYNPNHCQRSDFCESKLLCVDVVGNPCCVVQGVCPTKQQLDVKCVRTKPTNWCNSDYDCGRGSLCCDTGCGYNICVSK